MIKYSWSIDTVKTIDEGLLKNAVVQVYWTRIGTTEDNKTESFKSCTSFSTKDISIDKFVDIKDVTEDIVIGWIESSLSDDVKSHIDAVIEQKCKS